MKVEQKKPDKQSQSGNKWIFIIAPRNQEETPRRQLENREEKEKQKKPDIYERSKREAKKKEFHFRLSAAKTKKFKTRFLNSHGTGPGERREQFITHNKHTYCDDTDRNPAMIAFSTDLSFYWTLNNNDAVVVVVV